MESKTFASRRARGFPEAAAVAALAAVSVFVGLRMGASGPSPLSDFLTILMSILLEAFPFVLIGTILSSVIHLFVSPAFLAGILPRNRLLGVLLASLAGFAFPICECASVPVTRRLLVKGLPVSVAVAFLLSVAIVNPVVLLSTWVAFGGDWSVVLARGGLGMGIAILVGLAVGLVPSFRKVLREDAASEGCATCGHDHDHDHDHEHEHEHEPAKAEASSAARRPALRDLPKAAMAVLNHASDEVFEVGRFLILGASIAALMQVVVPRGALLPFGAHPALSVLALMILAYVLSLCSEADAFIAATFSGYFAPGAVVVFMVFGPMMDVKNTLMLLGGFKPRFVLFLLGASGLLCFLAGLALNLLA